MTGEFKSRRYVLQGAAALSLASAASDIARAKVPQDAAIERQSATYSVTPEHQRFDALSGYGISKDALAKIISGDVRTVTGVRQYIASLESYTKLSILLPEGTTPDAVAVLNVLIARASPKLNYKIVFGDKEVHPWIQDFGVPARSAAGQPVFVVTGTPGQYSDREGMASTERRAMERILGAKNIVTAPFAFDGGNTSFDVVNGVRTLFLGESTYHRDQPHQEPKESRESFSARAAAFFNCDRTVFLGVPNEAQFRLAFHADQSHLKLGDSRVLLARVIQQNDPAFLQPFQVAEDKKDIAEDIAYELSKSENVSPLPNDVVQIFAELSRLLTEYSSENAMQMDESFHSCGKRILQVILPDDRKSSLHKMAKRLQRNLAERTGSTIRHMQFQMRLYSAQQEAMHAQLVDAGYAVTTIDHHPLDTWNLYTPLNAKTYTNRDTGKLTIVFPVSERNLSVKISELTDTISAYQLTGTARAFYDACVKSGAVVKPVLDFTSGSRSGSTHCLSTVFANVEIGNGNRVSLG